MDDYRFNESEGYQGLYIYLLGINVQFSVDLGVHRAFHVNSCYNLIMYFNILVIY